MRLFRVFRASIRALNRLHSPQAMSSTAASLPVSLADVQEALVRVRGHVHLTPVVTCSHFNTLSGHRLFFKCEIFQKAGSFKIRGATNMILKQLPPPGPEREGCAVVTHSSGNHAQAVALAGKLCGVPAHIVMPENSPIVKVKAVQDYGGVITFCENTEEARKTTAEQVMNSLGPAAIMIPSSNHQDIMAGQGTIALEFLKQVSDLDVIVGSVSVGGFMAGISVAAKSLKPSIKIVAAEPLNADDTARSFSAGKRLSNSSPPQTVADALRMSVGDLTWPVLQTHLSGVVTVTEEEIITATRTVWERMKLVVEPSAACSVAAVLTQQFRDLVGPHSQKVGVVLCGGNVDLDHLPWN